MLDWIGYWLLPGTLLAIFVSLCAGWAWHALRRKRRAEVGTLEDEQIGSLTRRYVHGDLTLDEFEEQVDAVLRGDLLFALNPWWVSQETLVKYPQSGGTVIL